MSFAQRFAAGQQIAKNLMDTYDAAKRSREVDEIVSEKPVDVITQDDAASLHAAADSGQYDIGIKTKDDGTFDSYSVSPKASPEMSGNIGMGGVQFQGSEYKGGLTPKQVSRMKEGKLADLEMRNDPIKGMQLKRSLTELNRAEDEREEKKAEELGIKDLMTRYNSASPQERAEILKTAPPSHVAGLSKFVAANNELRTAESAAAAKHFMGLALKGDFATIERDYGAYNDGLAAKITKDADGKITVTRTKDGQPHDALKFTDEYDFASKIGSAYDPVGSVKAIQQQRAEIAKAKAAREAKVQDAFDIRAAQRQADGIYGQPRGTGAGGAAQAKADAAANRAPSQVAAESYMRVFKEAKDNTALPLPQDVEVQIENLAKNNPGMSAAQLNAYAVSIARDPKSLALSFDGAGNVVRTYTDQRDANVNFVVNKVPVQSLTKDEKAGLSGQSTAAVSRAVGAENLPLVQAMVHGTDKDAETKLRRALHKPDLDTAQRELDAYKRQQGIRGQVDFPGGDTAWLSRRKEIISDQRINALKNAGELIEKPRGSKTSSGFSVPQGVSDAMSEIGGLLGDIGGQVQRSLK